MPKNAVLVEDDLKNSKININRAVEDVMMNEQIVDAVKYESMIFHLLSGVAQISLSTPDSLSLTIV